jgi:hypothetical protein
LVRADEAAFSRFTLFVLVMQRPVAYRALFVAVVFILGATNCSDIVRPANDLSSLAGTYVLESTSGRYAPVTGSFVLTADAGAVRRVRYPATSAPGGSEYVTTGTFDLDRDGTIVFALNEPCGTATCVWTVHASRTAGHFTLTYPDPADGPPISETYARQ